MRVTSSPPNRTLRRLRAELGLSQEQYATAVGATPRQVRNWEHGQVTCPQTWYLLRMHQLHGTTVPEDLGFTRRGPRPPADRTATVEVTDQAEAAVFRRDLLGLVLAALGGTPIPALAGLLGRNGDPGRVGTGDVQRIERANTALYGADLLVGGGAVTSSRLLGQFRAATSLLHGTFATDTTRQRAHSAVAHLGSTVGFMLFDQGHHLQARQVYTASLSVAEQAHDRWPLRAIILSELARQCRHLGALHEGDSLVAMAHGADAELTPTGRAMLHALTATIAAADGNRPRALRYIRLAEDEYANTNPAHDPPWIIWFDPAELAGETGSAIALLATDHEDLGDQALHRLTTSATAHGASEQRSTALAWIRAAGVHAARRDSRHAANATRHALDVASRLRSPRVADELHHLRTTLQPLQGSNEITELIRQITKLKP